MQRSAYSNTWQVYVFTPGLAIPVPRNGRLLVDALLLCHDHDYQPPRPPLNTQEILVSLVTVARVLLVLSATLFV